MSATPSPWHMYVLHCRDKSYYCGITTNLKRRAREHNEDKKKAAKYTWPRRPVVLMYSEPHDSRSSASKAEAAFKKMNKSDKLEYMFKKAQDRTSAALEKLQK